LDGPLDAALVRIVMGGACGLRRACHCLHWWRRANLCCMDADAQDVNKEAGAEDRFKKIGEAYEVRAWPGSRSRRCGGAPGQGAVPGAGGGVGRRGSACSAGACMQPHVWRSLGRASRSPAYEHASQALAPALPLHPLSPGSWAGARWRSLRASRLDRRQPPDEAAAMLKPWRPPTLPILLGAVG